MGSLPSTEGVTLSGRTQVPGLKTDSILENSVPDTDAEGAKGVTPQSLRRKDRTFHHTGEDGIPVFCRGVCFVRSLTGPRIFYWSFPAIRLFLCIFITV